MDYWWDPCSGLCGANAARWVVADLVVYDVCRPSQTMLIYYLVRWALAVDWWILNVDGMGGPCGVLLR